MRDRRRAFHVVDAFEEELAAYTGAPYAVTTDSCTNALFLSLRWKRTELGFESDFGYSASAVYSATSGPGPAVPRVGLPKHTYVGVAQAARNAGYEIWWWDEPWHGSYQLRPWSIIDSAKKLERGMYQPGTFTCLSFQAAKLLPIGRGGAILTDSKEAAAWLKRARLDGRTQGADYQDATYQRSGYHMYMTPPDAARGLWLLTYLDDNDQGDWTEYPDLSKATWA